MDHTFGHQEILDSLSQGSGKKSPANSAGSSARSRSSTTLSSGNHKRSIVSSSTSSAATSQHSQQQDGDGDDDGNLVDEAYRRQGKRLSYLAHGEVTPPAPPVTIEIYPSEFTCFVKYDNRSSPLSLSATSRRPSVLKRLIFQAKYSFRKWEDEERLGMKLSGTSTRRKVDSVTVGMKQIGLQGSLSSSNNNNNNNNHSNGAWDKIPDGGLQSWRTTRGRSGNMSSASKGLLSAVLESQSDNSTSASGPAKDRSTHTSPSQSISTKDSRTFSSSVGGGTGSGSRTGGKDSASGTGGAGSGTGGSEPYETAQQRPATPTRGKCLTLPAQPVSNAGLDNADGNLILFENDALTVPRKSIHTFGPKEKSKKKSTTTFRVQKLLGQGTFAQVFQCLNEHTNELVAVKIVKSKPAYTRQATVEIDVFRALQEDKKKVPENNNNNNNTSEDSPSSGNATDYMVNLNCYFMYQSHLCLVFQLLGLNLYEVLKRRQFRGMPLPVVRSIVKQGLQGIKELSQRSIVHCDLKPENILVVSEDFMNEVVQSGESRVVARTPKSESDSGGQSSVSSNTIPSEGSKADTILATNRVPETQNLNRGVKLIDFGSACFEGYTAHTYIQSRFYRSPEVILGLPYDSAIDMWSLGCLAAELFLGLPILPGVHEHDQLNRVEEMVTKIPDWMLEQGTKAHKYYIKFVARLPTATSPSADSNGGVTPIPTPTPPLPQWRMKTLHEYVKSLSKSDIEKKGGLAKLEKPPGNRYFRNKSLAEVLKLHSSNIHEEDKLLLNAFSHFLHGLLDPDPWKRWTAFQAVQHPFITGQFFQLKLKTPDVILDPKETNLANLVLDYHWKAPWDPAICRRKLLNVQKMREKQQAMRRTLSGRSPVSDMSHWTRATEPSSSTNQSSMRMPVSSSVSPPGKLDQSKDGLRHTTGKVVDATPPFIPGPAHGSVVGGSVTASMVSRTDDSRQGGQSYMSGFESGHFEDYAYALQRPGVVPANSVAGSFGDSYAGSYAASVSSHAGSYSSQNEYEYINNEYINNAPRHGVHQREYGGQRSPQSFAGIGYREQGSYPGGSPGYASTTQIGRSDTRMLRRESSSQYDSASAASSVASSAPSSVTADSGMFSSGYEGGQGGQTVQQMGMFQQQGMQPFQMQMGMQQAPVVTQVQAPDGGFYFVMTSPTGQTMLLQPVASSNQPQQMPMYGGQVQGVVQTQQTPLGQFMPHQNMQFQSQVPMQQGQTGIPQAQTGMPQSQTGIQGHIGIQQGITQGQIALQQGQTAGQMFQGGMQFVGGGMNQRSQFQPQQQTQQQFYQQTQTPQQMQFQPQQQHQQFFQQQMHQPQQYSSLSANSIDRSSQGGYQQDASSRRSRNSVRNSGRTQGRYRR